MNLEQLNLLKYRISRTAAFCCLLCLIFGTDGGVAYLREPANLFRLLPGETTGLTGPIAPGATRPDQMTSESSSGSVSVSIDEVISGFWLGVKMWRGTLRVDPAASPGQYDIVVLGTADGKKVGANTFEIVVYRDRQGLIADSKSIVLRETGISPWLISISFFGLVLVGSLALFLLAGKSDVLMADQGEAEIFHVVKNELGISIYFGLGERHGVSRGAKLLLMDDKRQPVGEITVESVSETDAVAKVEPESLARPGYLVKKVSLSTGSTIRTFPRELL